MNMIFYLIHVAGNVLLHSIRTATFCWVAAVLVVAVLVIRNMAQKKSDKNQGDNCTLEGIILGMCFGLLVGTMLENHMGVAISSGMIIGLIIVTLIAITVSYTLILTRTLPKNRAL